MGGGGRGLGGHKGLWRKGCGGPGVVEWAGGGLFGPVGEFADCDSRAKADGR